MAIDYDRLMALDIPETRSRHDARDAILYAFGIGLGQDPMDQDQLAYVYEKDQRRFPTNPVVMASSGFWMRDLDTGIDWTKIVHGEQRLRIHRPMPVAVELVGKSRVTEIVDKGPGKGALVLTEKQLRDAFTGELYATVGNLSFCRADGGFGGPPGASVRPPPPPDRRPDHVVELATRPEQALVYRLSGDMNPLHAEPAFAKAAGFDRPILHGLCTYGTCAHAVVRALGYDDARLRSFEARFSAVVFPGDRIAVEIWEEDGRFRFQARVPARDALVLTNGVAEIAA